MSRPSEDYDDNLLLYTPCTEALACCHLAAGLHERSHLVQLRGPRSGVCASRRGPRGRHLGPGLSTDQAQCGMGRALGPPPGSWRGWPLSAQDLSD